MDGGGGREEGQIEKGTKKERKETVSVHRVMMPSSLGPWLSVV